MADVRAGGRRPRRPPIFGAEPWQNIAGRSWSWWDAWCCAVAVDDHDGDLGGLSDIFIERLRAVGGLHARDGNEAILSHVRDLSARLDAVGLMASDLATRELCADRTFIRRAHDKVLKSGAVEHRARTAAMLNTPRTAWVRRARFGAWEDFPSDPRRFYDAFSPKGGHRRFIAERQSFDVARRLSKKLGEMDGPRRKLPERLALYRGVHTVGLEIADAADDSCGAIGEARRDVWETYLDIDWRAAGMSPKAYWQDVCDLAIWEPYAVDFEAEQRWFASANPGEVDMIEGILLGRESVLREAVLDSEADEALELLAMLYVATGPLERCRGAAERLGSRAWGPIVTMAQALLDTGRTAEAVEVFTAADQPGLHRDVLRRRCRDLTGVALG